MSDSTRINWTRLSCRILAPDTVRLQLHALAYNLDNVRRTPALPPRRHSGGRRPAGARKLIKIGAKVVSHARYVTLQMAEVAVPHKMFRDILSLIARRRAPSAPA